jgi:hypothetical protein
MLVGGWRCLTNGSFPGAAAAFHFVAAPPPNGGGKSGRAVGQKFFGDGAFYIQFPRKTDHFPSTGTAEPVASKRAERRGVRRFV